MAYEESRIRDMLDNVEVYINDIYRVLGTSYYKEALEIEERIQEELETIKDLTREYIQK